MKLSPRMQPGSGGFKVYFRHPLQQKKLVARGLGTSDKTEAEAVCRDAERIFSDPELLKDSESPRLLMYHPRAVALVFGKPAAERVESQQAHPSVSSEDIGTLRERLVSALLRANVLRAEVGGEEVRSHIGEILKEYESERYRELNEQFKSLENELKSMRPRCEEAEAQLADYRRQKNEHVKVRIGDAVAAWSTWYEEGRAPVTVQQARSSIESFVASLPERESTRLAHIEPSHIDAWLMGLRKLARDESGKLVPTNEKLSPVSKKKHRAYLSTFYTWAQRKYKLSANPLAATLPLAGVSRNPEHIVAIRRETDVRDFIDALKDKPYWQAWAAVAIFAGPRWAEQQWLKIEDIYLAEDEIRITSRQSGKRLVGTKTGRERVIPIEQTVLKPILAAHIARRKAEQKRDGATVAEASPWLFPSTLAENPHMPREKTLPGLWSSGRAFLDAWQRVVREVNGLECPPGTDAETRERLFQEGLVKLAPYWSFSQQEWRHCFGTLLGRCGWTSLEISHAMGNSASIAERHYISRGTRKERWAFKF